MLRKLAFGLAVALCLSAMISHAQTVDSVGNKLKSFPTKLFSRIQSQSVSMQQQLTRQTERYLKRMARQEEKIKARLNQNDSVKAARLFPNDPVQQYATLTQKFKHDSSRVFTSMGPQYLPYADSLQGTMAFLNKNPNLLNADPVLQAKMQSSLAAFQALEAKLQQSDAIKQYIQNRKVQIQQYLSKDPHLPSGITTAFQGYNKEAYYYADQVRQYRQMLNDPDKMMHTALTILNNVPAFTNFMKSNGFLAALYTVPAGYGTDQATVGMQTRSQVLSMIQNQVGQAGATGTASLQQSLQTAQQDISNLQHKLSSMGAGSNDMDMPNFKVNDQKNKAFLKRLVVGVDFQTTQTTYYYPAIANFGLSLGYKLGNSNVIGVGAAYKLGLGSGFQHIALTNQGIGLRSFLQIKVKGTWGAAGGFEYNYQQPFASYQDIKNLSMWTRSGLIGVTKTVSMKSAVFKKTQVQLLWDFLSYSQVPKTPPLIFRLGYSF